MKSYKLIYYVPLADADRLRKALGDAGAGKMGDYTHCSFASVGKGRFLPGEGANPTIGQVGKPEVVEEERVEMICDESHIKDVLKVLKSEHPYEEVAYDVFERIDL